MRCCGRSCVAQYLANSGILLLPRKCWAPAAQPARLCHATPAAGGAGSCAGSSNGSNRVQSAATLTAQPGAKVTKQSACWSDSSIPRLVRCERKLGQLSSLIVSTLLVRDLIKPPSKAGVPVHLAVAVHGAEWQVDDYILSLDPARDNTRQQEQQQQEQQQQQQAPRVCLGRVHHDQFLGLGPVDAKLRWSAANRLTGVPRDYIDKAAALLKGDHKVVLEERRNSWGGRQLLILHIQPGVPLPNSQGWRYISNPAGYGMGLQVFAGSMPEVQTDNIVHASSRQVRCSVPKILVASQLPAPLCCPAPLTLSIVDPTPHQVTVNFTGGPKVDPNKQYDVQLYSSVTSTGSSLHYFLLLPLWHDLGCFVGRPVDKMALTFDGHLTITLAPFNSGHQGTQLSRAAAAAAQHTAAATTSLGMQQEQELQSDTTALTQQQQQQPPSLMQQAASSDQTPAEQPQPDAAANLTSVPEASASPKSSSASASSCSSRSCIVQQLPAGLQLAAACDPLDMELRLQQLLAQAPAEHYHSLMKQLRVSFRPPGVRFAAADSLMWRALQCSYAYVQAAVDEGRMDSVLEALQDLLAAARGESV